jgi:predicted nicotinamide N-methyase
MYKYLQSLDRLNKLWRRDVPVEDRQKLPFHIRPKAHMLQHMVEDKLPLFGSPARFWCYRDEDYVGAIKNIAAKTKHPNTLEQRLCEKLRIWAALESLETV